MSFDLKLLNGDIVIGNSADFAIVIDNPKLIQDTIKMVTTPQGSNRFQPAIGSLVNQRLIGKILNAQTTIGVLQSSVQEALIILQKLQKQQMQTQMLSPAETLISITDVSVTRDSVEPRQLNVILKIMAGDGQLITDSFTVRLA
jgi:hypothetical protein